MRCFLNDPATTEIYTYLHTLSLHDALPISQWYPPFATRSRARTEHAGAGAGFRFHPVRYTRARPVARPTPRHERRGEIERRSEENTSELQSIMRISYAVFCLKKKNNTVYQAQTNYCTNKSTNLTQNE